MKILSLWKSHYSLGGRSILTLEAAGKSTATEPDSIIDLALKEKFNSVTLIDDSISGFLEAYKNLTDAKIKLIFGIRLTFVPDMAVKDEESLKKACKYIILIKNLDGYKRLIKIWTQASHEGFYYNPRFDFKTLKGLWSDKDLQLCVPFYDSFLFNNCLTSSMCVPEFSFTKPVFFTEDNELFFDDIIKPKVEHYCKENNYDIIPTKSIYYNQRKDFKAYMTFRCIHNRSVLNKPQLNHCSSSEFSLESFKKKNV